MNTEVKNVISASQQDAQYDEKAKRILGNKNILAHILVNTIDEFREMKPQEVVAYIEGEPLIGIVPVEPGMTNAKKEARGQRTVGMNTENSEINEGLIRFDIIFYVRMKDGLSQIIVNVEAQKDLPEEYDILNRAVFYVSRLVSSQKERDFVNMNYDGIKRVFSIWVCMNMDENCMAYVHLSKENLIGSYNWKGKLDLLNIVLIGITNEIPKQDKKYELHRLLSTLFSTKMSVSEKLKIINNEFDIPTDSELRKDVSNMCNLSQWVREEGMREGREEGRKEGKKEAEEKLILTMHKKGYNLEQIAECVEKSVEDVEAIIAKKEPVLA